MCELGPICSSLHARVYTITENHIYLVPEPSKEHRRRHVRPTLGQEDEADVDGVRGVGLRMNRQRRLDEPERGTVDGQGEGQRPHERDPK